MSDERDGRGTPADLPDGSKETLSGRIPQAPEPYRALAPEGPVGDKDPLADADGWPGVAAARPGAAWPRLVPGVAAARPRWCGRSSSQAA